MNAKIITSGVRTLFLLLFLQTGINAEAQSKITRQQAEQTMLKATQYMVEEVSNNGGYVWYYMPDLSRQWGEMEAYKSMIWLQHPGTISMGHVFLDAYHATGNEYYYKASQKAAKAVALGQNPEGGWNYMVDFAGTESIKQWYNTIGKNGWRLEEFQHYYGNSTFDDDVSSDAARFLLRMYLEKKDSVYKKPLDKAINFILQSQYANGGWPQRYPLRNDFEKQGFPDYTSFYTFNDDVIWENIHFLIQCYVLLGDTRFLEPIQRGMNFYRISQDACGAWGQQLNMNMEAASARTYEPTAFLPSTTCENAFLLLKFYELTGDPNFLKGIPKAIHWLEETKLPAEKVEGYRTHPTFVDPKTNEAIYVHRKGSNVTYGTYYVDHNDKQLLAHYYGKSFVPLEKLKAEYTRISELTVEEATKDSPLKGDSTPSEEILTRYDLNQNLSVRKSSDQDVDKIVSSLDSQNRWLIKHAMISHPYTGDGQQHDQSDLYATTTVGDETDTSPFRDPSDQEYISTNEYIRNMKVLIRYIESLNASDGGKKKHMN